MGRTQLTFGIVTKLLLAFVFFVGVILHPLASQSSNTVADSLKGMEWLEKATALDMEGKYEASLQLYKDCVPLFRNCGYLVGYFKAKIAIAYLYSENGKPAEAKLQIGETIREMEQLPAQERPTMKYGDAWLAKGNIHYAVFETEPAIAGFERALAIYEQLPDDDESKDKVKAFAHNNLASINLKDQNFPKALYYVKEAIALKKKALGPTHTSTLSSMGVQAEIWLEMGYLNKSLELQEGIVDLTKAANDLWVLARSYRNISEIYQRKKDFKTAEEYVRMAIETYGKADGQYILIVQKVAYCEHQMGNVMKDGGRYSEAIAWYKKAIEKHDRTVGVPNIHTANSNQNIGMCYADLGEYDKALKIYREVWDIFDKMLKNDNHLYVKLWFNMGSCYFEKGNLADAEDMYFKAYSLAKKAMPKISNDRALSCYHLATVTDDVNKALSLCQEGLQSVSKEFNSNDLFDNPLSASVLLEQTGLLLLKLKIKLLEKAFAINNDYSFLETGLETVKNASALVDLLRQSFFTESAKNYLAGQARDIYEKGVDIVFLLNEKKPNSIYLSHAFLLMEKSRSLVLLEELQSEEASKLLKIPDTLAYEKDQLKKEVLYLETALNLAGTDKQETQKINEQLFHVKEKYIDLEKKIGKLFPEISHVINDMENITIEVVQKQLKNDEVVLEYLVSDDKLFLLKVSKKNVELFRTFLPNDFQSQIIDYVSIIKDPIIATNTAMGLDVYLDIAERSNAIYQILFGNWSEGQEKRMLIIPDLWLSYLPFEILLTSPNYSTTSVDYSVLPYLIRQCPIHYAFSANLQFGYDSNSKKNSTELLAFAPKYEGSTNKELVTRDGFTPLEQAEKEVSEISELLGGTAIKGAQASESSFKNKASEYGILHLAMHAFTDEENPMASGLIFSETPDGEDGILRAYELQNMSLNAQLAVLSACNTGSGKLEKGEGIMSIGRSFRRAGVPNIVMSLWQVDDEATRIIMANFYKYLKDGLSTDEALQHAKLDYIEAGRKTYPLFWGAFIYMGNSSGVNFSATDNSLIFLVLVPIISLLLLFFGIRTFQKRKKNKTIQPTWQ